MTKTFTLFALVLSSISLAHADGWSYSFKERNGALTTYHNPVYQTENQAYFPSTLQYTSSNPYKIRDKFCEAMGHADFEAHSGITTQDHTRVSTVVLNDNMTGVGYFSSIYYDESIFCLGSFAADPSSAIYSRRIDHSDGTFTIVEPRFAYKTKKHPFFTGGSLESGICRLFGGTAEIVSKKVIDQPGASHTAISFEMYSSPRNRFHIAQVREVSDWISEVTCRKP